jgi:hypothetical protein
MKSVFYRNKIKAARAVKSSYLSGMVCASMLICLIFVVPTFAQSTTPPSPPIGPATYRSDQKQIGIGVITSLVKGKVAEIIKNANDAIRARTESVKVELREVRVNKPSRVGTQYTNRPNQWFVKVPMNIHLEVVIPASSNRQIYIPLDINISCDNWHTGRGALRLIAQPGPISVEGGNIIEEVLRVKDFVDSQVKNNLPRLSIIDATPGNPPPCSTIGTSPGDPPDYRFGFIAHDAPIRVSPLGDARAVPTVEVTFQKLKRLRARGRGAVLYKPTEEITLETYANYSVRQSAVLTMSEDDEVNLGFPPFILKAAGLETLVIIANVNQKPLDQPQDSAFNAWPRSMNFSPGTHTLQITKVYVEPRGPGRPRPMFIRVPAYELTYNVRYTDIGVVSPQ